MLARGVGRILGALQHVRVPLHAAASSEDAKRRDKGLATELTTEAVGRVHLADHRMGIPRIRVRKELPAEASVGRVLPAAYFVGIPQRFAVGRHEAHHPVLGNKQLVAMPTREPVRGVFLAGLGMPVPRGWVGELPPAKAAVPRVRLAADLVRIPRRAPVAAAEPEDVVGRHEGGVAELALKAIQRVHNALDGVGVPGIRVGKELAAEALVGRVRLAAYHMGVPR
mmetsp:Transcript_35386/g.95940  ORF Transcript_35386/g.95940 Transcript_35386/m.95940 type:complete len:225 (-) Transcript_35386:344-1018(-)